MKLNEQQAKETIKAPKNKKLIQYVMFQESQLRVFTENLDKNEIKQEAYWTDLLHDMRLRAAKKFDRVIQFARYPLPIVQISDSILSDYYKVFEGKNRFFDMEADRDISMLKEWVSENKPTIWIQKKASQVFKNKPNSFVVVDINENGNPYLVYVDSNRLVDAEFKDEHGHLEYISFIHSQAPIEGKPNELRTYYSVYDEESYFVFYKDSDSDNINLLSEQKHNIGYCPARSFISTPENSKNKFKRRVAFTSSLSKLEDWSLFDVYRNFVDHYAPFPVTEAPKKPCPDPECVGGMIPNVIIDPGTGFEKREGYIECKSCKAANEGSQIFPGTHIGIQVSKDKNKNDGSGVFRMIFPETETLKYVPEKLDDIELDIRYKTVGINSMSNTEAFNEMQVKGSFVSMESILTRTKTELDILYKWIIETVANVYYTNISINVEANFGTEWYLVSEEELQKRYDAAKKAGLPYEELFMIYIQLIETKYKGNEQKIKRQKMLIQVDPLPLYSPAEVMDMASNNIVTNFVLIQKINFLNLIAKFEHENGSIIEFGSKLELYDRIKIIKETLKNYTNEIIAEQQGTGV